MLAEATHAPDIAFQIEEMAVNHEAAQPHLYQHKEFGLQKYLGTEHTSFYYDRTTSISTDSSGAGHLRLEIAPTEPAPVRQDDQIIGRPVFSDGKHLIVEAQHAALRIMVGDVTEALETYLDKAPVGLPVLQAFGYSINSDIPDHKTFGKADIALPSMDRVNSFLDFVRTKTGFAPQATEYDGGEFPLNELREYLMERAFLVSNQLGVREHDKLVHVPVWCLQPVEVMEELVQRTTPDNTALLKRIDTSIDARLFVQLTNGNSSEVEQTYAYLLFDTTMSDLSNEKQATVKKLSEAALARTQQIMDCAQEFNALELAA